MTRATTRAGIILATLGVSTLVIELGLYWLSPYTFGQPHAIHAPPVLIGCVLGFVGFYLLDPHGALEGGRFLVQSATGVLAIVRGGAKRPGDVVIGKTEAAPAAGGIAVAPAPAPPATDTDTGDAP